MVSFSMLKLLSSQVSEKPFAVICSVRSMRTSSELCLKKLPAKEMKKGPPAGKLTFRGFVLWSSGLFVVISIVCIASEAVPYALNPYFRIDYRKNRPKVAEWLDTVLRIERQSVVLDDLIVVEEARRARRQ